MPTMVVMPSVEEDGEESIHSPDSSQHSRYPLMTHSPNDMPLLQGNESSADLPMQSLPHPETNMSRRVGIVNGYEDPSSPVRPDGDAPPYVNEPRGAAPAYFEAVDLSDDYTRNDGMDMETSTLTSTGSPDTAPQRRSGFRSLLNALPGRLSISYGSSDNRNRSSHSRGDSDASLVSHRHRRDASRGRASDNRPSTSGSGSSSFLNLSPFRTTSRQSNTNLNSPSLISINSISSPLSHTLVRTEFTYPKAGPTPEQLRLISSPESFARFGIPYGADAIAYAASASRQDVDAPPPEFADLSPETSEVPRSMHAGSSRLHTTSNVEVPQEERETSSLVNNDIQRTRSSSPQAPTSATSLHPAPLAANPPRPDPGNSNVRDPYPSLPSSERAPTTNASSSTPAKLEPGLPQSRKGSHASDQSESSAKDSLVPVVGSSASPSSYGPSHVRDQSESRSSLLQSYGTATESIMALSALMDSGVDHSGSPEPTTPKVRTQHVLQPTDATVTQVGMNSGHTS
jgi:hypothetical protein